MTIESIQAKYKEIAIALGSDGILPTTRQRDGSVHIEHHEETYVIFGVEPGPEPYSINQRI